MRKQLEGVQRNLKEVHTSEKQVYYMRDQPEGNSDKVLYLNIVNLIKLSLNINLKSFNLAIYTS